MFRRPKPIGGHIAFYGLERWWNKTFSEKEASYIEDRYKPLGAGPSYSLVRGTILNSSQSAAGFLTGLSSWFSAPRDRSLQLRILQEAESRAKDVMDRHFIYSCLIEHFHYGVREKKNNKPETIRYCERQVDISGSALKEFKKNYPKSPLPGHVGFQTLAVIREQDGDFEAVIDLSNRARKEGWAGDWDKRIDRCKRKAEKQFKSQKATERPKKRAKSPADSPGRFCGTCGNERAADLRFCGNCGSKLG